MWGHCALSKKKNPLRRTPVSGGVGIKIHLDEPTDLQTGSMAQGTYTQTHLQGVRRLTGTTTTMAHHTGGPP